MNFFKRIMGLNAGVGSLKALFVTTEKLIRSGAIWIRLLPTFDR